MSEKQSKKRPQPKVPPAPTLEERLATFSRENMDAALADPFLRPPGIPFHRDLDAFVAAAELADRRWSAGMELLLERIRDEVPPEAQNRAYRIAQQLNILWQSLWVHRCFLPPLHVKTPQQLARWG
jgi:hypothetical protein